jgi:hypothetical protein
VAQIGFAYSLRFGAGLLLASFMQLLGVLPSHGQPLPQSCKGKVADHSPRIANFRFATVIDETPGCQMNGWPIPRLPCSGAPFLATSRELRHWKSVMIDIRVQAGMKSRSCIIWVLGLLLAIASIDTVPDPPAVNPRSVSVASLCEARGDVCERRLNSGWFIASLVQVRWIAFTSAYEPKLPADWIALTGLATDPSPPTL